MIVESSFNPLLQDWTSYLQPVQKQKSARPNWFQPINETPIPITGQSGNLLPSHQLHGNLTLLTITLPLGSETGALGPTPTLCHI